MHGRLKENEGGKRKDTEELRKDKERRGRIEEG
jgi:hypothetical protein